MPAAPSTCPIVWFSPTHGPTPCGAVLGAGELVCKSCVSDFAARLRTDVPEALDVLAVTIARGDQFRRDVVRRASDEDHDPTDEPELGAHGKIPVNMEAMEVRRELSMEVARWCRTVHGRSWRGVPWALPAAPPSDTAAASVWLADIIEGCGREGWLPTMVVRIDRRVRRALDVCDRPDDRIRVQCPACGSAVPLSTDPEERIDCRGWVPTDDGSRVRCVQWGLQRWWVEQCAPANDPARAGLLPLRMEAHGFHVKPETIRQWISRGDLKPEGTDDDGRPVYDVAKACVVAEEKALRKRAVRAG